MPNSNNSDLLEQPFPLKRLFYRRIFPGLSIALVTLLVLGMLGTKTLVQSIYLSLAKDRALSIALNIEQLEPDAWNTLLTTRHPDIFFERPQGKALLVVIQKIVTDTRTDRFKLYNKDRVLLYSPEIDAIGKHESNASLDPLFREAKSLIIPKTDLSVNELYVPLLDKSGNIRVIFELYEKRIFLDQLLFNSFAPTLIVPSLLFITLFTYLFVLIGRAQSEIDSRSHALSAIKQKLEQFVSFGTINAATAFSGEEEIQPQRIATTIYYSDVRSFTSLADTLPPTEVVDYLNTVMSVQLDIIKKHQGDIDKLIGDAVLAQFDGTDGERRALAASLEIIEELEGMDLARGIGIGIQSGDVLACTVGSENRKDFTIIGDTVNLAARLCSAADNWEIVVEERTLRHSGQKSPDFIGPETIQVKGHEQPIEIYRWRSADQPEPDKN